MKKLLLLFVFLFAGVIEAQILNIPDPNLKAKLLAADTNNTIAHAIGGGYMRVDFNNDGEIQMSEATFIDSLNVNNANIADLSGISNFNNLKSLQCANNQLTALNLSSLTRLKKLWCGSNNLSSLNLNGLVNLESVSCYGNNMTDIALSGLTNLKFLEVGDNVLTDLNLNSLVSLEELRCGLNQFAALDLSALVNLKKLDCSFNQLTSLDLTGLTSIERLRCDNNQLSTLDVSQQTSLIELSCRLNNLNSLFIKNGIGNGNQLYFDGNDNIQFICADASEIAGVELLLVTYAINDCVVNSYCSSAPGGNYNTIAGDLTLDENGNGCDSNNLRLQNVRVNVSDGINSSAIFSNNAGVYKTYAQVGNFQLTPILENPSFFTITPATASVSFGNVNNNTATQNFCMIPNGVHSDVEVTMAPITPARPGFNAIYELLYRNNGNKTEEIAVNLAYNEPLLEVISYTANPTQSTVGGMSWVIPDVKPLQSGSITITFRVNSPMDTPPVNIGDTLNFIASSLPSEADETPLNNSFTLDQTITGSLDPNDITCLEGKVISPEKIGNYLHYNINFENTGNAAAENIVVKEIVDTTKFDISTLQILDAPSATAIKVTGNTLEVFFEGINLEASAHGHALFKIKTKGNLVVGSSVSKKADIYFDYNFPVETNTATSTFQLLSNPAFESDDSVVIYPNPATSQISVKANSNIKSIKIFDAQGRLIHTNLVSDTKSNLDIATYTKGIYFLKVSSDKGIKIQKIIKE